MDALFSAIDIELNSSSSPIQGQFRPSPLYRNKSANSESTYGNPSPLYKNLFRNNRESLRDECLEDDEEDEIDEQRARVLNVNNNPSNFRGESKQRNNSRHEDIKDSEDDISDGDDEVDDDGDGDDDCDEEDTMPKIKRRKQRVRRNWITKTQLDSRTSQPELKDDIFFLKGLVLKKEGKHVDFEKGNKKGEKILICKEHANCKHLVRIGPGVDGFFRIMTCGVHKKELIKTDHGIAPSLMKKITDAAKLNITAMNIRIFLKQDKDVDNNLIPSNKQLSNFLYRYHHFGERKSKKFW
jgi:hypothetical protein